jgi:CelD/BcsL family acetyltransferase involved in cellulose biosynthesis
MHVEVVQSADELSQLESQWNELISASESDNPFLQWEWCSTWWRHYGAGHELAVVLVREGGQLVGLAPLYLERGNRTRESGVLRFLGSGEVCSEYLGFVLRRGREQQSSRQLLDFLLHDSTIDWRQLRLTHVVADTATAMALQTSLPGSARTFRVDRAATSWHIELANSWDAFLKSVGGKRRGKIRRALREFDEHKFEYHEITRETEIAAAWDDLTRLHQARWEQQGKPGCFASHRFAAFHRELLGPLWRRGGLLLTSLRRGGETIAASYCLRHRGRVYFYQGGISPAAMPFRPGHCLRVFELRRAIERGDRVFDFLSGEEDYKSQWATHQTEMLQFAVAGRGILPRVQLGFESATRWAKQAVRSRLPGQTLATLRRWRQQMTTNRRTVPARSAVIARGPADVSAI